MEIIISVLGATSAIIIAVVGSIIEAWILKENGARPRHDWRYRECDVR